MKTETQYMENEIINAQITVVMATITFYFLFTLFLFCFMATFKSWGRSEASRSDCVT